jgi:hypothetical protein
MKAKINGVDVECSVEEFRLLMKPRFDFSKAKTETLSLPIPSAPQKRRTYKKARRFKRWETAETAALVAMSERVRNGGAPLGKELRKLAKTLGRTKIAVETRYYDRVRVKP